MITPLSILNKRINLSVIVPNYNHSEFLPECINSVLDQSFQDFELIIVDDCSTDNSVTIIKKYQFQHSKIKLFENEHNLGVAKSVNKGFELSQGRFVCFVAADNLVLPEYFKKSIGLLNKNPSLGLCVSYLSIFQNKKPYIHYTKMDKVSDIPMTLSPDELIVIFKKKNFQIAGHSTIYKRELFQHYGMYDESLHCLCDWYINLQIALNNSIGYIPEFFSSARIGNGSFMVNSMKNKWIRKQMYTKLLEKLKTDHDFNKKIKTSNALIQLKTPFLSFCFFRSSTWSYLFPLLLKLPLWIYKKYTRVIIINKPKA